MCENRVSAMAFDSMALAFGLVSNICDNVSGMIGLDNSKVFLEESLGFEEKYQLLEEIGKGAFGKVHRATVLATGQQIAIKVINRLQIRKSDEKVVYAEVAVLKILCHRHIGKFFDFCAEPSTFYIALELIEGGELFTRIAKRHKYDERCIRNIVDSLLSAIKHCHDHKIIHRDLKPENILLTSPAASETDIKIVDFGLAADLHTGPASEFCGTVGYMAPEVFQMVPYEYAVDMWSLGVVVFCLFCGYLPFPTKDVVKHRRAVKMGTYALEGAAWKSASPKAREFISKLLTPDPSKRYTAQQAMTHPWMQAVDDKLASHELTPVIASIRKFNAKRKFHTIAKLIVMLAKTISPLMRKRPAPVKPVLVIDAEATFAPAASPRSSPPLQDTSPRTSPNQGNNQIASNQFISEAMREQVISALSDAGEEDDELSFEEKYTVYEDQVLGHGAFAVVVKGALKRNGMNVAIKIVDRTKLSPSTEEVMKAEAEILESLNHPHVIRCHDFYKEPLRYIIVMELVEGGDLLTRLARKTVYSEKDARDLVEILLSSVSHCHNANIVHRDLKLDNLLLVTDRDDNKIKLADFGLACKVVTPNLEGFCGTLGYVAPEIMDFQLYGKPVDVWSCGVMVYALLGGYLPFETDSVTKYKHSCQEPVQFHEDFWAEVSTDAKDLIRKLLCRNPAERLTAAQALNHPWLLRSSAVLARRPLPKTLSQLKVLNLRRKFKAIAHSLIAHSKFLRSIDLCAKIKREEHGERPSKKVSFIELPIVQSEEVAALPPLPTIPETTRLTVETTAPLPPPVSAPVILLPPPTTGLSQIASTHVPFTSLPPKPATTSSSSSAATSPATSVGSTSSSSSSLARSTSLSTCSSKESFDTGLIIESAFALSDSTMNLLGDDVPVRSFKAMYDLLEEIGSGGFATVFRSRNLQTGDEWAVKVVDRTSLKRGQEKKIRDESTILQGLRHPNIIEFVDFFEESSVFFIVMEFIDGGELLDRIKKQQYYTEDHAREVIRTVLQAIKHCHDNNIVHRDIKPENLLMASKDDPHKIKLIDFGLAAIAPEANLIGCCGTLGYIAPELYEFKPHGKPVDMWSIGVLSYLLLGGYLPFPTKDIITLRNRTRTSVVEFHEEFWNDVSAEAKNLITRLLTIDTHKRLTVDQALNHHWINRPDLKHRLLDGTLVQIKQFLAKRKFRAVVKAIIAKGKFEQRLLSASNVSVREALHVSFEDLYELNSVIGQGSFGTVYEGFLKRNATPIAVKVIDRTNLKPEEEESNRIECDILQRLSHPHIISCLDFFEEPATFFIVMELVNGGELFDRIAKKVTYTEDEARNVLVILLSAIKHCHDHDVVHRDLKPENILLENPDSDDKIKLIDFGLAAVTTTNNLEGYCGSPGYIAPEIIELKPHGKPVDMWSVGIIAYVLLGGYLPYEAATRMQYRKQVLKGKLLFHEDYWSEVSEEAKDLITKLLSIDMDSRFTAKQALLHPWIRASHTVLKEHSLSKGISQFKRFNARRRFRSVSRMLIAKSKFEKIMLEAKAVPPEGEVEGHREVEQLSFKEKYQLEEEIGHGGFGIVYRAVPLSAGNCSPRSRANQSVAVKVLDRAKVSKKSELAIRTESEILRSLNHPHIIKCLDIYEDPSTVFIVMEIMEGGELFDRIVKKVYYSEKEARDVVRTLLFAVKHCHDNDVVHRDLKPENLLLASKFSDDQIKLIDFGLAGRASGLTLEGYCGTAGYTAPELFEHKPHGKPVDMWAVGVIAYVLLAGYLPFKAVPRAKYQQMARRGKVEYHPEYWKDISAEAKDLINNLMRVRVEKRYTAEQALNHPWLKASPILLRKNTLAKSMQLLRRFNAARKFRVIAKLIIAQAKFQSRMAAAKPAPQITNQIATATFPEKYEFLEEIGRGGFATVYKATQKLASSATRYGMFVAVKVIDRTNISQVDEMSIRREYSILQSLSHAHIIRCLDVFEEPSSFYIVMEMLTGGELFERLVKVTNYSEKEARDLVEILLSTIKHCHDHDVVHRDLKPENLLLVSNEYSHNIKVIDFGLAGIASDNCLEGYCGSPGYMAPEIIELKAHGKPVDMWSIGIIAYVLLGGYLPYEAASRQQYRKQVLKGKLVFHEGYWNEVSDEAKDLISKLLTINPNERLTASQALKHTWITESGNELKHHDLHHGLSQLKKFNAHRKFRSVVNLLIAKAKFERFMSAARLTRLPSGQALVSPKTPSTPAATVFFPPPPPL